MKAQDAFNKLDPQGWANTSIPQRLAILEEVRDNLKTYAAELGAANSKMKNDILGIDMFSDADGTLQAVVPMANNITASIHLYESLAKGEMPKPISIREVGNDRYDIEVYPLYAKDKLTAGKQKGYLRVVGKPIQVNPMDKPAGIIAVSGAGNYSSSIESLKALFFDNKVVLHKPHRLNEATDKVWEKIFEPLVAINAMTFVDTDQSREMAALDGLTAIYFTGSTDVAKSIMEAAKAPLISECGGNNPCLIVPGVRAWTDKEIKHQAEQIISISKGNGGAACGRPQTFITSKNWPQRDQLLEAIRKAAGEDTFAISSYYPHSDKVREAFLANQPQAEILTPENGKHPKSDFIFIADIKEDDYAIRHEAFCQIMGEVSLDTENNAEDFLAKAIPFCNKKLSGTLGCMLVVDNDTQAQKEALINDAITQLNYGGITVNTTPPMVWFNAYLTWGGCNEMEETFVSGIGNFGNALGFENVEKSYLVDDFHASGFSYTNKKLAEHMSANMSAYAIEDSWGKLLKMAGIMMVDNFRQKDF